jgi:hypothetical protein
VKLSDLTLIQVLGAILVINGALAGGVNELTDLLGPTMAKHVLSVCVIGSGICGGFITMFGGLGSQVRNVLAMPGVEKIAVNGQANSTLAAIAIDPLQDKSAPTTAAMDKVTATAAKAAIITAFLLAGLLAFAGDASAQGTKVRAAAPAPAADAAGSPDKKCLLIWDPLKLCGALTGKPEDDLKRVADRIRQLKKDDLTYAIAKAKASGTPASKVRLTCLNAINDANTAYSGDNLKDDAGNPLTRPDPAFITGIEDIAELIDNLSPQGTLFTSCAGAAQMFKTNTLTLINAIVTGAASIAAMPAGL